MFPIFIIIYTGKKGRKERNPFFPCLLFDVVCKKSFKKLFFYRFYLFALSFGGFNSDNNSISIFCCFFFVWAIFEKKTVVFDGCLV